MSDNRNKPCFCGSGKKQKKCHEDIVSGSAFAELILLHKDIDSSINLNTNFNKLKCKKGCAECCYQNFSVSPVEFYYIIYKIYSTAGIDKVYEYLERGYEMWTKYEKEYPELANDLKANAEDRDISFIYNVMEKTNLDNDFPCPFLNVLEGACSVYEDRPIICREYAVAYRNKHNIPIAYCSNTMDGIEYEEHMAYVGDINIDNLMQLNSDKYKLSGVERPFPLFYFCKIAYLHKDNILIKINEMKNITKEQYVNKKFERLLKRKNSI